MPSLRNIKIKNVRSSALSNQNLLGALLKCKLFDCNISGMTLVDQNPDYFTDINALSLTGVEHIDNTYYPNLAKEKEEEIVEEDVPEEEEKDSGVYWRKVRAVKSTEAYVLDKLLRLIREQKGLMHLDISNTGLTRTMVVEIAKMLRREHLLNLRSVHLNDDRQAHLETVDQSLIQELSAILGLDAGYVIEELLGAPNSVAALPLDCNLVSMKKDLKK